MSKKDIMTLAMIAAALSNEASLYGDFRQATSRRKITKYSECPEFGRKCPTRNGEMKPCSKYK